MSEHQSQTATKPGNGKAKAPPPPAKQEVLLPGEDGANAHFDAPRLPWHPAIEDRYEITRGEWKVLVEAIFPNARTSDSVVMAIAYCKSRDLDIMKRPVNIVPMWDSAKRTYVETVWPSIGELRTTACRTGEYAGCDEVEFGPMVEQTFKGNVKIGNEWKDVEKTVSFPEWARLTVYKIVKGQRCPFVGPKVYWLEAYAKMGGSSVPNNMWTSRTNGQLEKCAEAAALRRAFPEEVGNDPTAEEMEGQIYFADLHDVSAVQGSATRPQRRLRPPTPPGMSRNASGRRAPAPPPPSSAASNDAASTQPEDSGQAADDGPSRSRESAAPAEATGDRDREREGPADIEKELLKLKAELKKGKSLDDLEEPWVKFEGSFKALCTKAQWERAKGIYFDAQQPFHD